MNNSSIALYRRVLDDLNNEIPGVTAPSFQPTSSREFALSTLARRFIDKFQEEGNNDTRRAAEREFFRCNMKCASHRVHLGPTDHLWFEQALGATRDFLARVLGDCSHDGDSFWQDFRPGPGVSTDTKETGYAAKLYHTQVRGFPSAFAKTQFESSAAGRAYGHYLNRDTATNVLSTVEKLQFVPKNRRTDRPIGIQPLGSVCGQLAIGRLIQRRLVEKLGLDIERQADVQRRMVLTMRYATIDLKSASSLLSLRLVRELLPPNWFNYLTNWRSSRISYKSRDYPMYTFASMGNGYIFPLQTLIFASLVYGIYNVLDIPYKRCGYADSTFGVFGDDILCDPKAYDLLTKYLTTLGLEVNLDKSYKDGYFRESCGVDVYKGMDVRIPFLRTLNTVQEHFVIFNTLAMFYERWGIRRTSALQYLIQRTRLIEKGLWVVPLGSPLDSGLHCTSAVLRLIEDKNIRCWVGKHPRGFWLFKSYVARAYDEEVLSYVTRHGSDWLMDLYLSGSASEERLSLGRPLVKRYRRTWSLSINWDYRNQLDRPISSGLSTPYNRYTGYEHGRTLESAFMCSLLT